MFAELTAINNITPYLRKFKWTRPSAHSTFRCPYCGDSKKNPNKTRGSLFRYKDTFVFKCHNCGHSTSLGKFLQDHFPQFYQEYRLDKFREAGKEFVFAPEAIVDEPPIITTKTIAVSQLPHDHQAVLYVLQRKIPKDRWDDIGYTENFAEWVLESSGIAKYKRLPKDRRIIFELRDQQGNLFGVQGRALDKTSSMRYITIKFDDSKPKIFGMENVNTTHPIIITEGPIDSLFLPNALAICGGDISMSLSWLRGKDVTIALDNEPRSKDTVSRMEAAITQGFAVCFWRYDPTLKDINDFVKDGGIEPEKIVEHIRQNAYSGAKARVALSMWKKT